jgi:amino acid adenylation domain-containing protein
MRLALRIEEANMTDLSRAIIDQPSQEACERVLQYQQRSFQDLLTYVWKHSSFYRDYYQSYGIREDDLADISVRDLPFISKEILMENFDIVVTDRQLQWKELEQWIRENRDPRQHFHEDFVILHGSGSSGNMGVFVYDQTAWRVMNSTMASHLSVLQNTSSQKTKVAFYIASHGHFAGVITAVQMPASVYNVLIISLLERIEQVIEQLNSFQPHRLTGYSSSVSYLADLALEGRLRIQPQSIFVSGDPLTDYMEQKIKHAWSVPVYNLYASCESIFIAIKECSQEEMTVLEDLNILEVLDECNQPVSPGEQGRAVLTNLYNHALPILRYELGDYVVRGTTKHGSYFTTIQDIHSAKITDALPVALTNGKQDIINPRILSSIHIAGLEKIQFTSKRLDHIEIEYIAQHNINDLIRTEFQQILNMKAAVDTHFVIRRVHHLASDAQTGKLRLVRVEGTERSQPPIPVGNRPAQESTYSCRVSPSNPFLEFKKEDIEQSIPDRFEQQVRKYPDRLAVQGMRHTFTYDELNCAANRVAGALLAQRAGGEEPIGMLLEHGAPMIIAILGVLKAGKVYVSLDSSYPSARINYMLEDSQAKLIVTDDKNLPLANEWAQNGQQVLNIDDLDHNFSDQNLGLTISPDALAYILHTSGSTGQPKGVVQNHRNVLHNMMKYTNGAHICAEDRLSMHVSYSFSGAVTNTFSALLNGAALFPFDIKREGLMDLANWLIQREITVYQSVPTVFRHFLDTLTGQEEFPRLRLIDLFGEAVSVKDVECYKRHFPQSCILQHRMAATEMSVIRLYFLDKETTIPGTVVPVGYAVQDTEVLLLDEAGQEVGVNQTGEIAIKSHYLVPGYWRRPDLTRAKFLPDPKGGDERIYLTGDLGLMRPDGCLEHLGRKDFQVKIRGHRIEVDEIELVLLDSAAIKEVVVVAHEDEMGEKRLVAYVVPAQGSTPTASELRSLLQAKLPDYMIPSAFVPLDALPLTPNGKIDRLALPAPNQFSPELEGTFVAPCTPFEEVLAGIWAKVLGLQRIGVHENFFELGGHSLLATQVMSRVRRAFRVELPLRRFFEAPTVAGLALAIAQYQTDLMEDEEMARLLVEVEKLSEGETHQRLIGGPPPNL